MDTKSIKRLFAVFFTWIFTTDILNAIYFTESKKIYEMCFVLIMFEMVLAIILYFKESRVKYMLMFFLSSIFLFIHSWAMYRSDKGGTYTFIYFLNMVMYIVSLCFSTVLNFFLEENNPYVLDSAEYTRV